VSERLLAAFRTRRADVRGAAALLLTLVLCFVLLPLSALAVDIGMQRVARRDVQAIADTTALDMARTLGAGTVPTDAMAADSAARSAGSIGRTPTVVVHVGYVAPTAPFRSDQSLGCGGAATAYDDHFARPATPAQRNAVLVVVSTSVDFSLRPGEGAACRSAIAGVPGSGTTPGQAATACYSVGSFAAAVDTRNAAFIDPLLSRLAEQTGAFSNSAAVSALSFQGLATSQVDLARLAAGLRLGSVQELATATVGLHDLYVATLAALVQPSSATSVSALQTLVQTSGATRASVALGRIVAIASGSGAGATSTIDLLDLVGGSLAVVNGTHLTDVDLGSSLPGVAHANLKVTLIQGAHQFCGSVGDAATTATSTDLTEQLRVTATAQLAPLNATVAVPALPGLMGATSAVVALPNNVTTTVSVAPTSTTLTAIRCAGSPKGISLDVRNGLATVTLETYLSNLVVNADLLDLTLLGASVARLNAKISVNTAVRVTATLSPSGVQALRIDVPSQSYDRFYPAGSGGAALGPVTTSSPSIQVQSNVSVLGLGLGAPVNLSAGQRSQILDRIVTSTLAPMFDATNPSSFVRTVVDPVLGLAGAQIGGSLVALHGTPPPTCEPRLLG
jgi:uncharacterized membrane protein